MIEAHHINKSFDKVIALIDINLSISAGELFGLIGPDGAGKTTLFRILTTLLLPDSGDATINGLDVLKDVKAIRKIVGYMPGRFSLYQDLSIEENLNFFATIFGTSLAENYDIIRDIYVQIEPFKKRRAGKLSGGMKQKLALCCALIHNPEILFLDEPTTGVDAVSRKEFWDMLITLKHRGITIMVSTPYMDEASMCDRIALIDKGKILSIETPEKSLELFDQPLYELGAKDYYRCLLDAREYPYAKEVLPFGEYLHMTTKSDFDTDRFEAYLLEKNHSDIYIRKIKPTVEDVFLHLMKTENHDG